MNIKNALQTALKIGVALALILWLHHAGALDFSIFARLSSPLLIVILMSCTFLQVYINNYRWLVLLRGQDFATTVGQTLPLTFIGLFFNFAMPGGVGGDVVKGYYAVQLHPQQKLAAAVSIFVDRIVGFFVMIGTAVCACLAAWPAVEAHPQLKSLAFGCMLLFLAFVVFFFLSFSTLLQKLALSRIVFGLPGGKIIRQVYETLHAYRHSPRAFLGAIVLSLISQAFTVAFVYAIGVATGVNEISLAGYFFLVPLSTVAQAIPIAPAGIGVGQAAAFFLFKAYLGHEIPLGPTSVTAAQLCMFVWGLVGLVFYLRRQKPEAMRHADAA